MATSTALPRRAQRDVTLALRLATYVQDGVSSSADVDELVTILQNLDARTGRRDPSKRTRRAARKSAKAWVERAAKKLPTKAKKTARRR